MKFRGIAVLVPTGAGRQALIQRLVESLATLGAHPAIERLIFVENGTPTPQYEAETLRAALPGWRVELLHLARGNKSAALNHALALLPDEGVSHILLLDDDVACETGFLEAYAASFASDDGSSYWGGPFVAEYEDGPPPLAFLEFMPLSTKGWEPSDPEAPSPRFFGFNMGLSRESLRRLGGFDETRGPGTTARGQETEFIERLQRAGYRARFVAGARVRHWVAKNQSSFEWVLQRVRENSLGRGLSARRAGAGGPGSSGLLSLKAVLYGALAACLPGSLGQIFVLRRARALSFLQGLREEPQGTSPN